VDHVDVVVVEEEQTVALVKHLMAIEAMAIEVMATEPEEEEEVNICWRFILTNFYFQLMNVLKTCGFSRDFVFLEILYSKGKII
jgi:hypothetical protein